MSSFGPQSFFQPPLRSAYVPQGPHARFSATEVRHILIAYSALTLALFIVWVRPDLGYITPTALDLEVALAAAAMAALTGFFAHEMAHKFAAQRRGLWAEFRMSPQGLMMALVFSVLIGFLFAAPGATVIGGRGGREEMGITSLAGPVTNLSEAGLVGAAIGGLLQFHVLGFYSIPILVLSYVMFINCVFAVFNLIPWGPLDGLKIYHWKKDVWVVALLLGLALGVVSYIYLPFV